jgi:hypothetical protein
VVSYRPPVGMCFCQRECWTKARSTCRKYVWCIK